MNFVKWQDAKLVLRNWLRFYTPNDDQKKKLRKQFHSQLHQKISKIPRNTFNQGHKRLVLRKL